MLTTLLAFLPIEALPLIVIVGALGVIFGLVSVRGLMGLVIGLVVLDLVSQALWPVAGQLFSSLSLWWQLIILIVGSVMILRLLLSLLFGSVVGNHVVSFIVYDVFFRIPARILGAVVAFMFGLSHITRGRQ